jgi:hypothetical protein
VSFLEQRWFVGTTIGIIHGRSAHNSTQVIVFILYNNLLNLSSTTKIGKKGVWVDNEKGFGYLDSVSQKLIRLWRKITNHKS